MIRSTLQIIVGVALVLITGGAWPGRRYGAAVAIGTCILLAGVLHFAAP
jgi:hypothetical protein